MQDVTVDRENGRSKFGEGKGFEARGATLGQGEHAGPSEPCSTAGTWEDGVSLSSVRTEAAGIASSGEYSHTDVESEAAGD